MHRKSLRIFVISFALSLVLSFGITQFQSAKAQPVLPATTTSAVTVRLVSDVKPKVVHPNVNPIFQLPQPVISMFTCIIWHESTSTWSHLNLQSGAGTGDQGVFQFADSTWAWYAGKHKWYYETSSWSRGQATHFNAYQQELVAADLWRADGFWPWHGDGCV